MFRQLTIPYFRARVTEDQRVKFINIVNSMRAHPDFETKYLDNPDPQNTSIAFEKIPADVMLRRRREEMDLYKLYAQDEAFKTAWIHSLEKMLTTGGIAPAA